MKIFFVLFTALAIVLAAYPFLNPSEDEASLTGLPWQIDVLADGSTNVFGLHIGKSRLSDAIEVLGKDMDMAIIAATDESGNLEMYYGHYKAGLLSGKLILQTNASEQDINRWIANSPKSEYMASGLAKKHIILDSDLSHILEQTIKSLTFIPTVNLDENVILARFGEPEKRIVLSGVTHYLYPEKGLDIALHEKSKEVMQYVTPETFKQLMQPFQ